MVDIDKKESNPEDQDCSQITKVTPSQEDPDFNPFNKKLSVNDYVPKSMTMEEFKKLSRNAQKKVMRDELWELKKPHLDKKRKERAKAYKQRRKERIKRGEVVPRPRKQIVDQQHSGVSIIFDMSFDHLMQDNEIVSISKQIEHAYAANKTATRHTDLCITHLDGRLKTRLDTRITDHKMWLPEYIKFYEEDYLDLFPKDKLVYLTADSPNILSTLDMDNIYIVGGLVDKNRYPKLTLDKANKQGISHGQLPIGEYIQLGSRSVLTVNQVYQILLSFLDCHDWKQAFLNVIPERKLRESRVYTESQDGSDDSKEAEGVPEKEKL
ncbi:tRNA (guanine(9)-N(1))-methyltransferase [Mycoemilia scoparia]|uniref:tRNA (guanine(9)-N1)-methyltransferase n=1 Tax=Mycoemilia scoparia TaxID=417184 RepID=A0A9W8A0K2_9FUNG|nr:tRNA (guanine(9)-N(1))-methyltransferase [Mycoemilia scoparia]